MTVFKKNIFWVGNVRISKNTCFSSNTSNGLVFRKAAALWRLWTLVCARSPKMTSPCAKVQNINRKCCVQMLQSRHT